MNNNTEFSEGTAILDEVGRCSIRAISQAASSLGSVSLTEDQLKQLEISMAKTALLVREKANTTRKDESHLFIKALIIQALITETTNYGLAIGKICLNEDDFDELKNNPKYELLGEDITSHISSAGAFPPFYAITGNGLTRHVEFIESLSEYRRHLHKMTMMYNDNTEAIIEVRQKAKKPMNIHDREPRSVKQRALAVVNKLRLLVAPAQQSPEEPKMRAETLELDPQLDYLYQKLELLSNLPSKENLLAFFELLRSVTEQNLITPDYYSSDYLDYLRKRTEEWENQGTLRERWSQLLDSAQMNELLDALNTANNLDLPVRTMSLSLSRQEMLALSSLQNLAVQMLHPNSKKSN